MGETMNDFDEYGYQERTEKEKRISDRRKGERRGNSYAKDRRGLGSPKMKDICRVCGLDHNHDCEG